MTFVPGCPVTMTWVFPSQAADRLRDSLIDSRAFAPSP